MLEKITTLPRLRDFQNFPIGVKGVDEKVLKTFRVYLVQGIVYNIRNLEFLILYLHIHMDDIRHV